MSEKFIKKWEGQNARILTLSFKQPTSLRTKVQVALRRIEAQVECLQTTLDKLIDRDKHLFSETVEAYSRGQHQRAKIIANEIAELRRITNLILSSQLALEQVALKLRTVTQMGDMISVIAPATKVIENVKSGISSILPQAEKELEDIGILLNDIMIEAGEMSGYSANITVASEDAKSILAEAAAIAEQKMKEKLPDLPALKQPEGFKQDFL
ncbi:MAG: Snf7 family protein [Nitrososphaerota archaeon]|nr:Snf7 family protein [Candidatus Bathyarchaeota archaeon]MDW8049269.1 Snf7 family protein [Nitrososphaerota archaeon]